jgi:hypothetical protein
VNWGRLLEVRLSHFLDVNFFDGLGREYVRNRSGYNQLRILAAECLHSLRKFRGCSEFEDRLNQGLNEVSKKCAL